MWKNVKFSKVLLFKFRLFNGALTNKPYAFRARSWELISIKAYDCFDSLGQAIYVEMNSFAIFRILPASNYKEYNWLSDKARFGFDSVNYQRLLYPILQVSNGSKFFLNWVRVLGYLSFLLKKLQVQILYSLCLHMIGQPFLTILGCSLKWYGFCWDYATNLESFFSFLKLRSLVSFGVLFDFKYTERKSNFDQILFLVSPIITNRVLVKNLILLIGIDLRFELPILNIHYRQLLKTGSKVFYMGMRILGVQKYNFEHLGNSLQGFFEILEGRHWINNLVYKEFISQGSPNLILISSRLQSVLNSVINSGVAVQFQKLYNTVLKFFYSRLGEINYNFLNYNYGFSTTKFLEQSGLILDGTVNSLSSCSYFLNNFNQVWVGLTPFVIENDSKYHLQLPVPMWWERCSSFFDIMGTLKKMPLITFPPKASATEIISNIRTESKILDMVNLFITKQSVSNNNLYMMFLMQSKDVNFITLPIVFLVQSKTYKWCLKVKLRYFVVDFFNTENVSKNSKILNLSSAFFNAHISNYN